MNKPNWRVVLTIGAIAILLLSVFASFVLADTQIVRTDINVTANSWMDTNANQTRMNLTIRTESAEEPKNYIATNVNSLDNSNFIIRVIKDLNCNQTDINRFINNSLYFFNECEGSTCVLKYNDCKSARTLINDAKINCESERLGLQGNFTICQADLTAKNNQYAVCESERSKLVNESEKKWWFGAIGILIGAFGFYWFGDKTHRYKPKSSREEREGVDITGEIHHPDDWNDGIGVR